MVMRLLKSFLHGDFARREDGSIAIETVIILPAMFWAYLALFNMFDAYRQYTANQKAAFTIGDMVSRETAGIDEVYLDGSRALFDYLTRSREESAIRISSLKWNGADEKFERKWSKARGWVSPLNETAASGWIDRLPIMKDDEHIVVLETWSKYDPPFNTGLKAREIRNFVFTRPRYASCVLWLPDNNDCVE